MDKFSRSFKIEPLVNMIFEVPKLIALKKVKLFCFKNAIFGFEEKKTVIAIIFTFLIC